MKGQKGATLLVALILLVLMTLAAIMTFNLGRGNLLVVGNQQTQQVTAGVARAAIEEVISSDKFASSPSAPFGSSNSKSYDVNGDGTNDVTVTLTPQPCIKSYQIVGVDVTDTTSLGCVKGVDSENFGIEGASGGASSTTDCADIIWEITAIAQDLATETTTTVVQGTRIRQDKTKTTNSANYCS